MTIREFTLKGWGPVVGCAAVNDFSWGRAATVAIDAPMIWGRGVPAENDPRYIGTKLKGSPLSAALDPLITILGLWCSTVFEA